MQISRREMMAASAALVGVRATSVLASDTCAASMVSIDGPPEYIPGAPQRTSLIDGTPAGQRLRVFGRALTTTCQPLAGAHLEFWHTNAAGVYDMTGHAFRGAQLTNQDGRFLLDTMMPGPYNGPRHIHLMLATRIGEKPQPLILSAGIFFPTPEEFAKPMFGYAGAVEYLNPASLRTEKGVLMVPCDIVVEPA